MDTTEQLKHWAKNMMVWCLQRYNCRGTNQLHVVSAPGTIISLPADLHLTSDDVKSIDWDTIFTQIGNEIAADLSIVFTPASYVEAEKHCKNLISVFLRMSNEHQTQYATEFAAQVYIEYYMLQKERPNANPALEHFVVQIPDKLANCFMTYPNMSLAVAIKNAKEYLIRQFSIVPRVTTEEIRELIFQGLNDEHIRLYAQSVSRAENFTRQNCGKIDLSDPNCLANLQKQSEKLSRSMIAEHFSGWDRIKDALQCLCHDDTEYKHMLNTMMPRKYAMREAAHA